MTTQPEAFSYEGLPRVCEISTDDIRAEIYRVAAGEFLLTWTDYVANEWAETFPTLPVALTRLACLMECERRNWEAGFQATPDQFTPTASEFLTSQV